MDDSENENGKSIEAKEKISKLIWIYFLLRYFMKNGAKKEPTAAPRGITPIRYPLISDRPAIGPKYR